MSQTGFSPRQWRVLETILPPNPKVGRPFRDHQQVIEGILWRLHNGTPWREIPPRYGPWRTCHARLAKWQRDGTWTRILHALQSLKAHQIDWRRITLDTTHIHAHRSARGARNPEGDEAIGRSRGGPTSKLHVVVDQACRPLAAHLTAGQASDAANLVPALEGVRVNAPGPGRPRKCPRRLVVDRAYGARAYRERARRLGIYLVCPERKDAKRNRLAKGSKGGRPPAFDAQAYKGRNVVERCVNRLKDFRAVATRYEKRGRIYLACVLVVMILLWL